VQKMIFVNLPVADLPRSKAFYEAIGFTNVPRFTDETAAAMQLSDTIVVMILTHEKWRTFTTREIPDAKKSAQVALCVSMDSREAVDAITKRAAEAGGGADPTPADDHGFMYIRSFDDPDGHIWESMWMDVSAIPGGEAAVSAEPAPASA